MTDITDIIEELTGKDNEKAFRKTREITAESEQSPKYYTYLSEFASLLTHEKSYVRVRAFILCCSQARWDTKGSIRELLPLMLVLLHDPKPTIVRQCLKALKEAVIFLPELSNTVRKELLSIDPNRYQDSMSTLISNDINSLLEILGNEIQA